MQPLLDIDGAWQACDKDLSKQAINAMIGLWGKRENFMYRCVMSSHEGDSCLMAGQTVEQRHGDVHSWVSRCKLKETWSMLPLYFFCLDTERLRLAQICDVARKLGTPAKSIIEFRADSVLIQGSAKKLESLTFKDLGCKGVGHPFKVDLVDIGEAPAGFDPHSSMETPDMSMTWNTIAEDGGATEQAREIVLSKGENLLVLGAAGAGKSSLVMGLVKELRERGEQVKLVLLL